MSQESIWRDSPSGFGSQTGPYASSWIDRLITWIERLPGPSWFAYILLFLASALINTGLLA
jgi:hypothetical protein